MKMEEVEKGAEEGGHLGEKTDKSPGPGPLLI